MDRRRFLLGAGSFALALPFLPSLFSRQDAQAATMGQGCFFVSMATQHGGIWGSNMYPDGAPLEEVGGYAGRPVRAATLRASLQGPNAVLSPVLTAPASRLTDALVGKLGVLRGLDIPFYIGHHTGGHLGNYARNDGNGQEGLYLQDRPRPTIDQIMAMSEVFYPDISGVTERSVAIGRTGLSWSYASPSSATGPIQPRRAHQNNHTLFARLFRPGQGPGAPSPLIVDRVLASYQRLRQGSRRLSVGDGRRLDEHMERLYEVERRLSVEPNCALIEPTVSSDEIRRGPDYSRNPASMVRFWQLHNDIIAAAFACGVCRIASVNAYDTFSTFEGDWHQQIAHQANSSDGQAQQTIMGGHQRFFSEVFLDLCEKLNAIEQPMGGTLLDDALVMWTQESGILTHQSYSIPIVTGGGAGGYFRTGQLVDFRNLGVTYPYDGGAPDAPLADHPGLIYNQWLATVLRSMGVDPSLHRDPEEDGGYGVLYVSPTVASDYVEAERTLDEPVPFVTA